MSVLDDIRRDYPTLYFLFSDPEVGPLLRDAVDPNMGFDQTTFQAKLQNTHWFRSRSQAQREWEVLYHTDPGTANRRRAEYRAQLHALATRLGVNLTTNELNYLSEVGLQRGQSPDSSEVMQGLVNFSRKRGNLDPGGAINTALTQINAISQGQWFNPATRSASRMHWARLIASGERTTDDFNQVQAHAAMKKYHHLAERIQAGETLADIANPLRARVAQELELGGPTAVDVINSPTWAKLLSFKDDKGHVRAMTDSEAMVLARQQPAWWQTQNGRQTDADMTTRLLNVFGVRKSD